jgi:hypothetical protein
MPLVRHMAATPHKLTVAGRGLGGTCSCVGMGCSTVGGWVNLQQAGGYGTACAHAGVSNFNHKEMQDLWDIAKVKPQVLQVGAVCSATVSMAAAPGGATRLGQTVLPVLCSPLGLCIVPLQPHMTGFKSSGS